MIMNTLLNVLGVWLAAGLCLSCHAAAEEQKEHGRYIIPEQNTGDLSLLRKRRSDDTSPLGPVVSQHSQDLVDIKAELVSIKARLAELENIVCFTVRFSQSHVTGLGLNQPAVFDVVTYNAGGGYDRTTGIFTAPASGTYVLSLSLQRYQEDETTTIMGIKKGGTTLGVAEAGYSPYEHGTMVVTAHLNRGDVVSVQMLHGSVVYGGMSTSFSGFRISPS